MSDQFSPHPESQGPYVSLVTGSGGPTQKAPFKVVGGMALAQFGLFVALLAPVTVSLLLKIETFYPILSGTDTTSSAFKTALAAAGNANASVLATAALVALVANPILGRLSDYTTSRFGRRRPWMFCGAIGFVIALFIVAVAPNVPVVLIGWCLGQLFGNMILAPLLTTIADQVPEQQRGSVSGNVGVMQNLGILAAAYVASWFVSNMVILFVLPAVFAAACVILYCFLLPDIVITERPRSNGGIKTFLFTFWVNPLKHRDFGLVWWSRFLITLSMFLFITYRGPMLQQQVHVSQAGLGGTIALGVLINTILLVVFAKIGGWLSDRTGNRKVFVFVATAIFAVGVTILAHTHSVPMFYVVEAIMGLGYGIYVSVDTALVVDVLPNPQDSAKDLGVLNIANALPQSLAALVGTILLGIGSTTGYNFLSLFWGAGVIAIIGAFVIVPVRSTAERHADELAAQHPQPIS